MLINNPKNSLIATSGNRLSGSNLLPGEPLWKRVPTHDENGAMLTDFMMLIPGLKNKSEIQISRLIKRLEKVLEYYSKDIVFADLNLKINTLWVSVRPVPGICLELAAAIHAYVPEAKLVTQQQ